MWQESREEAPTLLLSDCSGNPEPNFQASAMRVVQIKLLPLEEDQGSQKSNHRQGIQGINI